jgi:translation initiation factor IF-1
MAGDRVILYGKGGVGKTETTTTILKNPDFKGRLIYLMTEANSLPSVKNGLARNKIEIEEGDILYVYPKPKTAGFGDLVRSVTNYQEETKKAALSGRNDTTQGKENYKYFGEIFNNLVAFEGTCLATGKKIKLGSVDNFKPEDVLIIDGLSPISHEIWLSHIGDKVAISMTDYTPPQHTMNKVMQAIQRVPCHVIMLAHEKQIIDDDVIKFDAVVNTGVGNATYEQIMGCWTEVVHLYKLGTSYKMEGAKNKVYTITRKIPAETNLNQDLSKYGLFV